MKNFPDFSDVFSSLDKPTDTGEATIFPVLYKRAKTGKPQQWQILVQGDKFWTRAGQVDGVITESLPTVCVSTNEGRANYRSGEMQAIAEATSKHQKKIDHGYVVSLDQIDGGMNFFEPMLAHTFLKYKHKINWALGVIVQPKLDGHRCIITRDTMTTRNGKEYKSIPHIHEALESLFKLDPHFILDGEAYNHDLHEDFNKISSILRTTKPTTEDLQESRMLAQYHIYDCPQSGTHTQSTDFITRYANIKKAIEELNSPYIKIVPNLWAYSEAEVMKCHDEFVSQGYEGIIVRIPQSPYQNKRTAFLLKYKIFDDAEFIIEGIVPGVGNKAYMAGKINTRTREGKPFNSNIKATHSFLRELLINKDQYIGKKCTIRYFGLSKEERIPRFPYAIAFDPFDK